MAITPSNRASGKCLWPSLALALTLGACSTVPVMRPPATPLEHGLFLAEAADDGRHGISNPDPTSNEVARIVEPAFVDENSRVEVKVDAAIVAAGIRLDGTAVEALGTLTTRCAVMTERIGLLTDAVRKQREVARAYEDLLLSDPSAQELRLAALVRVQEQFDLLMAGPGADAAVLQADLALLERDMRAEAARSGFTVRMESFLYSPGRDPVALHLEGYDSLRQGELLRRDRFGLFLAGEGLLSFQKLADRSLEQAGAVTRFLEERSDLEAAQRNLSTLVVSEYAQLSADATVLARELGAESVAARAEATQGSLRAFLAQLSGEAQSRLQPAVNSLGSRLAETSARVGVNGLGPRLTAAANSFARARTAAANGQLSSLGGGVAEALLDAQLMAETLALDELVTGVEEALDGLTGELRLSIRASWGSSAVLLELRGWEDLNARARNLAQRAANLRLSVGLRELPVALRVPAALEVPSDRIPPTEFDLSLTSRQLGDRVVLRSTLMQDGKTVGDPVESHFRVSRFGWHTDTSPSVVMARTLQHSPGSANFSFVPAVSWLHTYLPRPEEKGWVAATMRTFQPSLGLHAALLNFSTDVEIEIGLGVDVGLWNGILQAGIGYNLMSDAESGHEYLFIGSSLISLVQAAQQGFTALVR